MDWTFLGNADWSYWGDTALRAWVRSWAPIGGLAVAAIVAVLALGLSGWRFWGVLLKLVTLAALAATVPLAAEWMGFEVPADWDRDVLGYISMGGAFMSLFIVVFTLVVWVLGRLFPRSRLIRRATTIFSRPVEKRVAIAFATMTRGRVRAPAIGVPAGISPAPGGAPAAAPRAVREAAGPPSETRVAAGSRRTGAWLLVRDTAQGTMRELCEGDNTIGRDPENDVAILDSYASRRHAVVRLQDGQAVLYDLGSAGGTTVNGEAMGAQAVAGGDSIRVGDTVLTVVVHDRSAAPPVAGGDATMIAARQGGGGATLVVAAGPDAGKSFPLSEGDNLVGRDAECAVVLTDPSVSRRHALVRMERGALAVANVGGRTPVIVGDVSLGGRALDHDDAITIGHTSMTFVRPAGW